MNNEIKSILAEVAKFRSLNPSQPIPANGGHMANLMVLAERAEKALKESQP
jgi:hypothetical protein